MAVTEQTPLNSYTANGATTVFAFTFLVQLAADLLVTVAGATMVLGVDYTVSGVGSPSGGSVTFTVAPGSGAAVKILRVTDLARSTSYLNGGDLDAATVNADFDRIWMALQERAESEARALRAPPGEALPDMPAAAARASRILGFDASGNPLAGTVSLEQVAAAVAAAYVGGTSADAIGWVNELTGSQAQSIQNALRRRRVNIFDCLTLAEQLDVLACGHNYDLGAKLQAFSDAVYLRGGGVIEWPVGHYPHSNRLWIKQRVTWVGEGGGFREPYSDPYPAPEGTVLWKLAGSHNDGVLLQCDLTNIGGILYDTGFGTSKRNTGARHGGGIKGFTLWGNRSANPSFASKDRNNAGSGIVAVAARNIYIEENCSMMWADDCFNFGSIDFGTGLLGVNVARICGNTAMSSCRDGFGGSIGDSRITDNTMGFVGRHGFGMYLGNTSVRGNTAWNCGACGFYCSGISRSSTASTMVDCHAYDCDSNGFKVDGAGGGRSIILQACVARGNGRNSGQSGVSYTTTQEKANYYVTSSAQEWAIIGCSSRCADQGDVLTVSVGYYINCTNYAGRFEANFDDGLGTVQALPYIANNANVNRALVGSPAMITADVDDVRATITGNVLDVGNATNIVFSSSAPLVINTITYTGAGRPRLLVRNAGTGSVTLTYGSTTIKTNTSANIVMTTGQAYWISSINSGNTLWQVTG